MPDGILSVLVIVVIFVGLPIALLVTKDRIARARRNRTAELSRIAVERRTYERRILTPDWSCVERHLRRPVPPALRELYADLSLVMRRDFRYSTDYALSTFEALDEQGMADGKEWLGFEAVAFASTQEGDLIYLRPGPSEGDTLYLTHHDGNETEVFAATLQGMLDTLRRSRA